MVDSSATASQEAWWAVRSSVVLLVMSIAAEANASLSLKVHKVATVVDSSASASQEAWWAVRSTVLCLVVSVATESNAHVKKSVHMI